MQVLFILTILGKTGFRRQGDPDNNREEAEMRLLIIFMFLSLIFSCDKNDQKQAAQKEELKKQDYFQKGETITSLAQAELFRNVSQAMQKGGPAYAIEFCNLKALALKDSLSQQYGCRIRRIALKYRNPEDKPRNRMEKEQLNHYKESYQKGEPLKPAVFVFDDRVEYYQPIMINLEACLKCHGEPGTQITAATLEKIRERYPDDLATGFRMNDFRGSWQLTFNIQR